ncbi:MAG: FAD binding domain-containing protein [Synergistaceae bacterium]|nr:FAD binding domain-containing protein [Synergistaceae bacterium]
MNTKMLFPKDFKELAIALSQTTRESRVLAGGTDLIIAVHEGRIDPDLLIDVSDTGEMLEMMLEDNMFKIGASVCFSSIVNDPVVSKYFPALVQAAAGVGSKQIRNRGTIGGNIANASPAGDMLPPLIALGAKANIIDKKENIRTCLVEEMLLTEKKIKLAHDEAIVSVELPLPKQDRQNCFAKLGSRKAVSVARLNIAMDVRYSCDDKVFHEPVIVMGALGKIPIYARHAEETIDGRRLTPCTVCSFADALSRDVCDAIPNRYSLPYKKEAVKGLANDILLKIK